LRIQPALKGEATFRTREYIQYSLIIRLHQRQRMLITDENTGKQAIYSKRQINQLSIKVVIFDFLAFLDPVADY